jgi:hypothetical protein
MTDKKTGILPEDEQPQNPAHIRNRLRVLLTTDHEALKEWALPDAVSSQPTNPER